MRSGVEGCVAIMSGLPASAPVAVCKRAPAAELVEEARRRIGVVTGPGDGADADLVGLELLLAREAGDRQLGAGVVFLALVGTIEQLRRDLAEQQAAARQFGALRGVVGGDVADLVRHDGGDLGAVAGEAEQAAGDEDVAGGQREGVDDGGIEQRHAIGLARRIARGGELGQEVVEIGLDAGVDVFAAERGGQPALLGVDGGFRRRRLDRGGAWRSARLPGSTVAQAESMSAASDAHAPSARSRERI